MANILQPYIDRGELAGAVTLVADKQKTLRLECTGYADLEAKKPMRPDTLFWIASQTKPMTGTAVTMLIDEGKLSPEDPVEKFIPEFKNQRMVAYKDDTHVLLKNPSRPITVRDILSHTSGLPFASPMETPTLDLLTLRECALSYAICPLEFEPGTKYAYSNCGINTAGRIIEVVSGMDYTAFMNTRLFEPLGMRDTTFVPTDKQVARLAKCYQPNADKTGLEALKITFFKHPLTDSDRKPMPAGGLFSTATDCAQFMQMVLNDGTFEGRRYLSPEAVRLMTSKQTPASLSDPYGLGWSAEGEVFSHGGAYSTNMTADRTLGMVAIYLIQQNNGFLGEGGKAFESFMADARGLFKES